LLAGLFAASAVALFDLVRNRDVLLVGVLVGPLIAAVGASLIEVIIVGLYAIALSAELGEINGIFFTNEHFARMGVVAIAALAAAVLTLVRQRRDSELEITRPQAMDAQRLKLALGAGGMGTWRWNIVTGEVHWDEQLEGLYGLAPGAVDGSMAM
jgi:hypothetical protein